MCRISIWIAAAEKIFSRNEILIAYRPNKIFTFLGGYGKNFFGEGYRSLLLSDNASNYPFLKLETRLVPFEGHVSKPEAEEHAPELHGSGFCANAVKQIFIARK